MPTSISIYRFLDDFVCTGSQCPDTCCKGWDMKVDQAHQELYALNEPGIMNDINPDTQSMKRSQETDYCVRYTEGLCGIQLKLGTEYLSDTCHFYPRITHTLGDRMRMTAALSCPEIARLVFSSDTPFALEATTLDRLPTIQKQALPEGITTDASEKILSHFMAMAADSGSTPERIIARLLTVSRSLEHITLNEWPTALEYFIPTADRRLGQLKALPDDPYLLLQSLIILMSAAPKTARHRLQETIATMEFALDCTIDWPERAIVRHRAHYEAYEHRLQLWEQARPEVDSLLRRYIQAQFSMALFPLGGFGKTLWERTVILAVRFATVKLALMCHLGEDGSLPTNDTIIRVIQSLSRFSDHLAEPELSMAIYTELGWHREERLRGLVGDRP